MQKLRRGSNNRLGKKEKKKKKNTLGLRIIPENNFGAGGKGVDPGLRRKGVAADDRSGGIKRFAASREKSNA